MSVLDGCQEGKKTPFLKEVKCPKCGELMEVFVREGRLVEDTSCDNCKAVIKEGSSLSELE